MAPMQLFCKLSGVRIARNQGPIMRLKLLNSSRLCIARAILALVVGRALRSRSVTWWPKASFHSRELRRANQRCRARIFEGTVSRITEIRGDSKIGR